jgi:aminoglycoside phosphotransferase (APT) family kinase protein
MTDGQAAWLQEPPQSLGSRLPRLDALARALSSLLADDGSGGQLTILDRRPAVYASTFPSEVVRCRLGDASERLLYCKYSAGRDSSSHRHRGGVAYEAAVYRHVLAGLELPVCRCYGAHTDADTGDTWLVLKYLERVERLDQTVSCGLTVAARWAAHFHAATEGPAMGDSLPWLRRYDAAYYLGWVQRTALLDRRLHPGRRWLAALCARGEECVGALLDAPVTVIHGEYYPKNILYDEKAMVWPVDWESAAIAPGEIDLASLTERWPEQTVRHCIAEYQRIRPGHPRGSFGPRLDAARIYLLLRWLGEHRALTANPDTVWRLDQLRQSGERLGLI